jgi:hypothetical protein
VLSGGNLTNKVINLKTFFSFLCLSFVLCRLGIAFLSRRRCWNGNQEVHALFKEGGGQIGRIGELLQIPVFISAYFKFWIVAMHSTVAFLLLLLCP